MSNVLVTLIVIEAFIVQINRLLIDKMAAFKLDYESSLLVGYLGITFVY